jgi:hypothetical protein
LPRNELELKQEVREMRKKMRDTLDNSNQQTFNLKPVVTSVDYVITICQILATCSRISTN